MVVGDNKLAPAQAADQPSRVGIVHHGQQSSRQVPGETYMHNLRSRVYYFRKHHGRVVAGLAKLVLMSSLALKWGVTRFRRAARAAADVYASGLAVVWGA